MGQQLAVTPHPGYKSSALYWTRILTRLFPLPPPGAFPALSRVPSADEAEVIDRFIFQALRLTESAGLNGASGVRNSISRDGAWTVDWNFPTYEARTGLAAQFRQLYSKDGRERGSFYKVMAILRGLSSDGSEQGDQRLEMLKVWSNAIGALRSKGARRLADEKLGSVWPADSTLRPEVLIDTFFYAEHLHWDERRASVLAERARAPELEANLRYRYHEAVAPIAYLIILFACFVNELLKRSVVERWD